MLRLAALALGPLLARSVPGGNGAVERGAAISEWLVQRYPIHSTNLINVLHKMVDRAWRSLEVALGGQELHQNAMNSGADPALIEQLRQFIAIAPLAPLTPELRRRIGAEIHRARQERVIPGVLPTAKELASQAAHFLDVSPKGTQRADASQLTALAVEFRQANFTALATFIDEHSLPTQPLLVTAARYFLAREIDSDVKLLRELRFTSMELIPEELRIGFDRLGDALDRFTSVLKALLEKSVEPVETPSDEPDSASRNDLSATQENGFSINGAYLVAPIRSDSNGLRITPCPVCLTPANVPRQPGSWFTLRCTTCGIEFQASDGTTSPPVTSRAADNREPMLRSLMARRLEQWFDSGEPEQWVESRRGIWSEPEFFALTESLRLSRFWPLELVEVRRVITELALRFRANNSNVGSRPDRPKAPAPSIVSRGLIRTAEVYRTIDGSRWVPCPLCKSFNVEIPSRATVEISLTCSGCGRTFSVDLNKIPSPKTVPLPSSPPSFWNKVRKWFAG